MVYAYTFSKVIDDDSIDIETVHARLSKMARKLNIHSFEFRRAMFSWKEGETHVLHHGVVVSFWSQYKVSEEKTDSFALELNREFVGAKTCYLEQFVDGAIVNVYRPEEGSKESRIDRLTTND